MDWKGVVHFRKEPGFKNYIANDARCLSQALHNRLLIDCAEITAKLKNSTDILTQSNHVSRLL